MKPQLPSPLALALLLSLLTSACLSHSTPSESLVVPFLAEEAREEAGVWALGHQAQNEQEKLSEFVRPDETQETWTERLTVQALRLETRPEAQESESSPAQPDSGSRADDDPPARNSIEVDDYVTALRTELQLQAPGSTVSALGRPPFGVLLELRVPAPGPGPTLGALERVLDGEATRFVVRYTVRDASLLTPEQRAQWIARLEQLRLITP